VSQTHFSESWPTTIEEEREWRRIRDTHLLDRNEIYLNTGSYGSMHRSVFGCLIDGLNRIEANPTTVRGQLESEANAARKRLATFVNADPEDLAFTTNVTVSLNLVVNGLTWEPGDQILASDQEYGAIDNCLHHAEREWGVGVRRAAIPIPPAGPEDILEAFEAGFTSRTRLVVCSHIATRTGLIAPIQELAKLAHEHNAMIAIDGAHGPGMIPLDLKEWKCDFYGGNCHKWLCAPKGTGFLHAAPEVQDRLRHVFVGWGYSREGRTRGDDGGLLINGRPAMWGLETCGTRDLACFAAVAAAVDHQDAIGKDRVALRGRRLAAYLRDRLSGFDWAQLLTPTVPEMSGSISSYHLKGFEGLDLHKSYRITAPAGKRDGDLTWLRVSTHIYNGYDQIDRLVDVLDTCHSEG
jgi:isopenicillin-N epimerase